MVQDIPREVGKLLRVVHLWFEMLIQFVYFSTGAARILAEAFGGVEEQFMR